MINLDMINERCFRDILRIITIDIYECFHISNLQRGINFPIAVYLAYKISQFNKPSSISFAAIVNGDIELREDVRQLVKEQMNEQFWELLLKVIERYDTQLFAQLFVKVVQDDDDKFLGAATTPRSIIKLVNKLLCVKQDEKVADICCGCGSYFLSAIPAESDARYSGYDVNYKNILMVDILAEILEVDIETKVCDVFSLSDGSKKGVFDKIFSNYPFGIKVRNLGAGYEYFKKLSIKYPELSKATSSDWVFNALLCDLMKENGKAVCIMTNGSTWNTIDTPMRKYFVENKMIESVISLPNRMFSYTTIPTTIVVLSHDNETIRMIDATRICQQGRRQNELSDENIKTIVDALAIDTSFSKMVSLEELRNNEYVLNLSRYVKEETPYENGVLFESIIKTITRGAQCTAIQLDKLVSDCETNMQYLMLGNIQNGLIDDKLPYISSIEPKQEKYCIKNNSLILSKNGYPYKVAVANVKEGQKILANGNLYIIELDEEKANPIYVKAFFESVQGIAALKSISVGATIPNIGVDKLKKIILPLPSIEEQNRFAQEYQKILNEISVLRLKLVSSTQQLQHFFDSQYKDSNILYD